jgi:hypothetical protein
MNKSIYKMVGFSIIELEQIKKDMKFLEIAKKC